MQKNEERTKKINGKIIVLEEINQKINQIITSLKEEELLDKYEHSISLGNTSQND